MTGFFLLVAI